MHSEGETESVPLELVRMGHKQGKLLLVVVLVVIIAEFVACRG